MNELNVEIGLTLLFIVVGIVLYFTGFFDYDYDSREAAIFAVSGEKALGCKREEEYDFYEEEINVWWECRLPSGGVAFCYRGARDTWECER